MMYGACTKGHYKEVIMSVMASQITSLTIVYSTFYSGVDQRKHQRSASLALVVVILFPEEYNRTHSICTAFIKSFHKCIPLAVTREAEAH